MRAFVVALVVAAALSVSVAEAQTVFVPHGGRVIAVPLVGGVPGAPDAPSAPAPVSAMPLPADGGLVRIDGLPKGAVLAVDGTPLGGAEVGGAWIALPPGPHFIDVALPGGGGAIRLTVVTPVESSGYQVVPKP